MYQIEQLHSNDYEAAMDFINMVFSMEVGPTNFAKMLPAYYKPDESHMASHYAIREQGKIRALLGIYPTVLQMADSTLQVARVGAVSTHPLHQGRGMMRTLMHYASELIDNRNYDLAVLGGLRQRYLRFGYEKCGTKLSFSIYTDSLRTRNTDSQSLRLERFTGDNMRVVARLLELHDSQYMHAQRHISNFVDTCSNWNGKLYVGWLGSQAVGYVVSNAAGNRIYEVVATSDEVACDLLAVFAANSQNEFIHVEVPPLAGAVVQRLTEICDQLVLNPANSWLVLAWDKVITGLLQVKSMTAPLLPGEIVLGISGYGHLRVCITESGSIESCRTEAVPDLKLNAPEMMRTLFGPAPPELAAGFSRQTATGFSSAAGLTPGVGALSPSKAALLRSWCPLPLYLGTPDCT